MTHSSPSSETQLIGESKYLMAFEGLCEHSSENDLFRQYPNPQLAIQKALLDSFTGFHPQTVIDRLQAIQSVNENANKSATTEQAEFRLPQHWQWQAGTAQPMALLNTFGRMKPADEKTTTLFLQCLQQRRKSTKYLEAMTAVYQKYPSENALFDLIMTYYLRWDLKAAEAFFEANVAQLQQPLLGRFASAAATFWSLDSDEDMTPEREALFERLMRHQYTLEEHTNTTPTFEAALNFYKAVAFWYGLKRQLPLFVFALNQLHALEQEQAAVMHLLTRDSIDQQAGLKETLGQNYLATTRRLLQWFFYTLLDDLKTLNALRTFMQPLWKRKHRWHAGL